HAVLKAYIGKLHHVADRAIEGEHTAGKFSVRLAAVATHLHLKRAQLVSTVGHASGADSVGNQHRAADPLCPNEQIHSNGLHVNAVGDDVGSHFAISEDHAQQSRIAVVEAPHRVKAVRRVVRSRVDTGNGLRHRGIGVAKAHTHTTARGVSDKVQGSVQF